MFLPYMSGFRLVTEILQDLLVSAVLSVPCLARPYCGTLHNVKFSVHPCLGIESKRGIDRTACH